jgi:hypothetical protein
MIDPGTARTLRTAGASLRSRLWAASRAGLGRRRLASSGEQTDDCRSGTGKWGIRINRSEGDSHDQGMRQLHRLL